ncbi:RDD family protein [Endozoicomonas sp. Mp262]|uniref:RDD family protein n=1 Tax=Endozoicomonas sp. Mp262 TaxID=2919499 RepID=UPI0021D838F2
MQYVGFWKRLLAYIIDVTPIFIAVFCIAYFLLGFDVSMADYLNGNQILDEKIQFIAERNMIRDTAFLLWVAYGFFMDCSKFQGTHGKVLLGIRVVNDKGGRITFSQSAKRTVMKIVGFLPLHLGYIWAAFKKDKAAWHDLVAKTHVVKPIAIS